MGGASKSNNKHTANTSSSNLRQRKRNKPAAAVSKQEDGDGVDEDDLLLDQAIKMNTQQQRRKRKMSLIAVVVIVAGIAIVAIIVLAVVKPWESPQGNNIDSSSSTPVPSSQPEKDAPPSPSTTTEPPPPTENTLPVLKIGGYELLERVPHDPRAFTQGLLTVEHQDSGERQFYESTGQYKESDLRLVEIATGTVLESYPLADRYFAEGIAHYPIENYHDPASRKFGIVQLTWMEQTAFEYTFASGLAGPAGVANWTYSTSNTQGWGITYDPVENLFYVVDGSVYLHVWDAATHREIAKHAVTYQRAGEDRSRTLNYLNELEWDPVTRTILANVIFQDILVRIDPDTGFVTHLYDLSALYPRQERDPNADVLNGIALTYDVLKEGAPVEGVDATDQVWVTGKYWPGMYRIRLIDP